MTFDAARDTNAQGPGILGGLQTTNGVMLLVVMLGTLCCLGKLPATTMFFAAFACLISNFPFLSFSKIEAMLCLYAATKREQRRRSAETELQSARP